MAQSTINLGAAPNDNTGDSLRAGGQKINTMMTELYAKDAAHDTAIAGKADASALTAGLAAKLDASALDTSTTLASNSNTKVPSQAAVKAYVDQIVASQDAMVFKGVIDCSGNPNYPAADRGWTYRASVAGRIGGAAGVVVQAGDIILCLNDSSASGNQAAQGANWTVIQANLDGALTTSDVGSVVQAYSAVLVALAGASSNGQSLVTAANYAAMRTLLGLVIGTNVQAYSAVLATLTGASANGQSLITAADYTAMRLLLGIGSVGTLDVDTDPNLAANSNAKVPSQAAVKAYCDQIIAAQDAMVFKGTIDCSSNPNYPAAQRGWTYRVSVAGRIGGASGAVVEVGDLVICLTDNTASGNQATVGSNWTAVNVNIDGGGGGGGGGLTSADIGVTIQGYSATLTALASASANGQSLVTAANYAAMRTLLSLGGAALLNVGTTAGTVAAGDDSRITGAASSAALTSGLATKLDASALDISGTLASNSDTKVPSQKAVKTYVDQIVASQDAMVFKGVIDCSTNPNYPAADRGWVYRASVAGKIGGGSGINVEAGDIILCLTDATASGTQAAQGANWTVIQANLDGALLTTAVGVSVQAYSAVLTTLASASANGQSLITAANYAGMRTLLGLVVGTDVQAYSAVLTTLAGASANGQSLVTAANYAAMRTLLGLGGAAQLNVGTAAGTVAAGDDSRIVGAAPAVAPPITVTGATYTLLAANATLPHVFTNAGGCTVTLPKAFAAGWNAILIQGAAGAVTVVAESGGSTVGVTATTAQWKALSLCVLSNAGSAAQWWGL